jgi:hypothetical protein
VTVPRNRYAGHDYTQPYPASATGQVTGGEAMIVGWSFRETTGTVAATIEIFDGGDAGGQLVASISLAPGQSVRDLTGVIPVLVRSGLFLNLVSGTIRGSMWIVDL